MKNWSDALMLDGTKRHSKFLLVIFYNINVYEEVVKTRTKLMCDRNNPRDCLNAPK